MIAAACRHCGTPFLPVGEERDYCCAGCRAVATWIGREGLEQFYDLKGDRTTQAAGTIPFDPADWTWATSLQQKAEQDAGEGSPAVAEVAVQGMSCAACAWLIERRFEHLPGAVSIGIFPAEGRARLRWTTGGLDLPAFCADLARFGYRVLPLEESASRGGSLGLPLGLGAALWLNTMGFTLPIYFGLDRESELGLLCELIALASSSLAVLTGGSYFFARAWRALRSGVLHIDLPISIGIGAAYLGSLWGWMTGHAELFYFDFVATFIFLMLVGRWAQERAVRGVQRRVNQDQFVPASLRGLAPGDPYELAPGSIVPVQSRLTGEAITYSLEWITGEPEPLTAFRGQRLPAGARLLSRGSAALEATDRFSGSLLARLLEGGEARVDPLLQRVLGIYIAAVLFLAAAGASWWWFVERAPAPALQVAVSILVVSCPCALGVSIPLLNARAARHLEHHGLFIRDLSLWSRLGQVRQIVFDKTGTLTLPVPRLAEPEALERLDAEERALLSALVRDNRHPYARSLEESLATISSADSSPAVQEEPGAGVWLRDPLGRTWSLGKDGFRAHHAGDLLFTVDDRLVAAFHFAEALRPDAAESITELQRQGFGVTILSGDRPERVHAIAREAGIPPEHTHGRMTPPEKANWLEENAAVQALFLGDGANDSLGFDLAFCSGTPVSGPSVLETKADFHFLGRGLGSVLRLIATDRRRRVILRQLFTVAVAYNLAAVGVCLLGAMNPLVAAVVMPLSSLVSVASASRPLARREDT